MGCILCDDWVLLRAASSRQQWQAKETPSLFFSGLSLCSLCRARMRISYAYLQYDLCVRLYPASLFLHVCAKCV